MTLILILFLRVGWKWSRDKFTLLSLFVREEGSKCKFWEKKPPQVHLIIVREWPKNTPTILRNLDNFLPGAFYSTPSTISTIRLKRVPSTVKMLKNIAPYHFLLWLFLIFLKGYLGGYKTIFWNKVSLDV